MTRSNFLPAILGAALLSACGPTQMVVTAEIAQNDQSQDAEPRALGDLEIRLFPYDRDCSGREARTANPGLGTRHAESGCRITAGVARHRGPLEHPSGHTSYPE